MISYIKKHKLTSFIILVYIIVIGFAFFLYKLFIGSSGKPVYGDRLDGIEKVPITEEQITAMVDGIKGNEQVLKVTKPYLNGKILKVIIYMADAAEVEPSKALVDLVYNNLTDEQKAFYDVEVYVTKFYDCTLEATGKQDEEGYFVENVIVKFSSDLSENEYTLEYGLTNVQGVDYNKKQEFEITEDGEFIIYGYTKDKIGEASCSIQINKKTPQENVDTKSQKITSVTTRSFPMIAYRKAGSASFVWTKAR